MPEPSLTYTLCEMKDGPAKPPKRRRARLWHVSPEQFRELRHCCLLSRQACADYLGVSLRTVRHWDAGRNRVPWSVVRLLRLLRCGDLGALCDEWTGWTINRLGLHAPAGRSYRERDMRAWWLTCEQARLFREAYDRETLGGVGAQPLRARERVTLLPGAGMAAKQAAAAPLHPIEAAFTPTALARRTFARQRGVPASMATGVVGGAGRLGSAAAARSDAGLVISSTSGTRWSRSRMAQGFQGVRHAG
jgi:hypothetical protein